LISANSKYQQTVLVIDDELPLVEMLSLILETRGYKVEFASTGHEALEKIRGPVDLILLDLLLPDMEGVEVCHYLKQAETTRNVPIIILSSNHCRVDQKVQCFQLGADDFLTKPFDNEELFARMFSLLRRRSVLPDLEAQEKFELLRDLRMVIDQERVDPYFQPVYTINPSLKLFGIEVLSRPNIHGVLKDPELLFHAALHLGFYSELETLVWRKALNILGAAAYQQNVFFNCSPYLIEDNHFSQIYKIFSESLIPATNIFIELTERATIFQYKLFYERLKEYRKHGFKVAIDDVGSGYASLESIIETRPEAIKIDRHIVHGLTNDSYKHSVVKFIVSFCREHDIICVAEGVETKEEFSFLKELGVDACQGYYLFKPTSCLDLNAFQNMSA